MTRTYYYGGKCYIISGPNYCHMYITHHWQHGQLSAYTVAGLKRLIKIAEATPANI